MFESLEADVKGASKSCKYILSYKNLLKKLEHQVFGSLILMSRGVKCSSKLNISPFKNNIITVCTPLWLMVTVG